MTEDAALVWKYNAIRIPMAAEVLRDLRGWATLEEKAELDRLNAIGPLHGPSLYDTMPTPGKWTKKGKWITYGSDKGWSLCDCE